MYTLLTVAFCGNQFPAGNLAEFVSKNQFPQETTTILAATTQFPVQLNHKNYRKVLPRKWHVKVSSTVGYIIVVTIYIQLPISMVTIQSTRLPKTMSAYQ